MGKIKKIFNILFNREEKDEDEDEGKNSYECTCEKVGNLIRVCDRCAFEEEFYRHNG